MNERIIVFIFFLISGALLLVGYYFVDPWIKEWREQASSDSGDFKLTVHIGTDNWVGYLPLCSSHLRQRLRKKEYLIVCDDDGADYKSRMSRLNSGELQLAVATVDSFLLNAHQYDFPATIVAVLDESKGGDAIVGRVEAVASIEALRSGSHRIAYTPSSPSEFLLKVVASHFDMGKIFANTLATDGSEKALEALKNGNVDVAVLWEPDVSKALQISGVEKLLGSDDTEGLIIDILVASRKLVVDNPEFLRELLREYFATIEYYSTRESEFVLEVANRTRVSKSQAASLIHGVAWQSLVDNAIKWFGVGKLGEDGLAAALEKTAKILEERKDFNTSPIPQGDAYRLLNSDFVGAVAPEGSLLEVEAASHSLTNDFAALSGEQWEQLKEVGTLRILPITFQSGTSTLRTGGKEQLDALVNSLVHYPKFRIAVRGHTGTSGDQKKNEILSEERADSVKRYLTVTYGVDEDRILVKGYGSSRQLLRKPGESLRVCHGWS